MAKFAWANGCERQQADGVPGQRVDIRGFALCQQLWEFSKGDVRMMAGSIRRRCNHTQIPSWIGVYDAFGQPVLKYLM